METQVLDRTPEPPEAMVPPTILEAVMAQDVTDEQLAREMHRAVYPEQPWHTLPAHIGNMLMIQARTARKLLCPPSPADLRIARGKAARDVWLQQWGHVRLTPETWAQVADAVLAKKAEQDGDA